MLLNLGGPDSLEAVRPFLVNLFSDRQIIRLGPAFLQGPLSRLISFFRSKKTMMMYRRIGGRSPIAEITSAQASALERALNERDGETETRGLGDASRFKVYVGMRYWHPFIEDTMKRMYEEGIRRVVALSLYPHYSAATSGSSLTRFSETVTRYALESRSVRSWYAHPRYIDALVDVIGRAMGSFRGEEAEVLFSAHSLPVSLIESGDPYVEHLMGTIGEVSKKIAIRWHLSYQSRSGPVRWLSPSTEEKIAELARKGIRNLLVVPISFVSDHIETLYEIDILYKQHAERLGVTLVRSESLNTHPLFIEALKEIVLESARTMNG